MALERTDEVGGRLRMVHSESVTNRLQCRFISGNPTAAALVIYERFRHGDSGKWDFQLSPFPSIIGFDSSAARF